MAICLIEVIKKDDRSLFKYENLFFDTLFSELLAFAEENCVEVVSRRGQKKDLRMRDLNSEKPLFIFGSSTGDFLRASQFEEGDLISLTIPDALLQDPIATIRGIYAESFTHRIIDGRRRERTLISEEREYPEILRRYMIDFERHPDQPLLFGIRTNPGTE